ncbi:MAG TPA: hypothetical protein VFT82_02500 [Candidatus Paceibacterota bacterium]|nr:hypothetical protein [Candidatus Paceibacterota bacterium]
MILELTLMTVSGLGMIALLVHRHLELSRGVAGKVREVRAKTDPILTNLHHTTGRFFSYFTLHNFVLLVNYAFVHVVRFFMNIAHEVHTASSKLVEKASKKTEDLSRSGAASFYLKQIKETKDGTSSPTTDSEKKSE